MRAYLKECESLFSFRSDCIELDFKEISYLVSDLVTFFFCTEISPVVRLNGLFEQEIT